MLVLIYFLFISFLFLSFLFSSVLFCPCCRRIFLTVVLGGEVMLQNTKITMVQYEYVLQTTLVLCTVHGYDTRLTYRPSIQSISSISSNLFRIFKISLNSISNQISSSNAVVRGYHCLILDNSYLSLTSATYQGSR